jgi:hypothetical protein
VLLATGAARATLSVWDVSKLPAARRLLLAAPAVAVASPALPPRLAVGAGGRIVTVLSGRVRAWAAVTTFTGLKLRGAALSAQAPAAEAESKEKAAAAAE